MVTMVGVFGVNNSVTDMWFVLVFGVLGYLMRKAGYEPGPLVLAFVLGVILERSFRQSLIMSQRDLAIFVSRPGSLILITVVALGGVIAALVSGRRSRQSARQA